MSTQKRKALGRGLAALIPGAPPPSAAMAVPAPRPNDGGLRAIPIEEIHPSAEQPRKRFDDARLGELAESIRAQGIIQPLLLRKRAAGGYELVAGERRWRAAQRAGLHDVPAMVRDVAPPRAFEMAMVENLQREDLNPIEEATGYQRLIEDFGYTQEALSARVGKDRSTIANALRLLRLPPAVRDLCTEGRLSMGHARALLGLEDAGAMERLARRTVARELSVRQVEAQVRRERGERNGAGAREAAPRQSAAARDLANRLSQALGTRVEVEERGPGQGEIVVHYHSLDQLDALLDQILSS